MTEAFCRITVVTPHRRVDLTVPAGLACAEILPEVVRLSGEGNQGAPLLPWALGRVGEPPLRPERTLAQGGVLDGDLLYLNVVEQQSGPVVVDDLVEAIADAVDARSGQWSERVWRELAVVTAGVLTAMGALLAGAGGRRTAGLALVAATLAVVLCAGALGLRRLLREEVAAATLALAALPWWALAATSQADQSAVETAAAGTGLLVGAAVAAVVVPAVIGPSLAVALPAASLALGATAVALLGVTPVQVAAVLAVCLVPAATALPRLAIAMAGISSGDEDAETAIEAEHAKVAAGHALLTWLLSGAAVAVVAALAVLVGDHGVLARCLAGAVAVAVGLRARAFCLIGEILPLALAALGGAVALEAAIAGDAPHGPARQAAGAGLLVGTAVILAAAGFLFHRASRSPAVRRRVGQADALVNLLLIPFALGVLGVYGAVERLAQRLGS